MNKRGWFVICILPAVLLICIRVLNAMNVIAFPHPIKAIVAVQIILFLIAFATGLIALAKSIAYISRQKIETGNVAAWIFLLVVMNVFAFPVFYYTWIAHQQGDSSEKPGSI